MAQSFLGSWKNCTTCAYWTGARTVDNFGQRATVKNSTDRGKCANPTGGWKNIERTAVSTCSKWERWPALKK